MTLIKTVTQGIIIVKKFGTQLGYTRRYFHNKHSYLFLAIYVICRPTNVMKPEAHH
jgi:hypothetical protein